MSESIFVSVVKFDEHSCFCEELTCPEVEIHIMKWYNKSIADREKLDNALINAAGRDGNPDKVKECFHKGMHVDAQFSSTLGAIHYASIYGRIHIVKYLVEKWHVDVNKKTKCGLTALHFASLEGHLVIVQYLLQDCHVDVSTVDNNGHTALHMASGKGRLDVVRWLVNGGGANVNAKSNEGHTALHSASQHGQLEIVRFFIKDCHVDVSIEDRHGYTASHLARNMGHMNIVRSLREKGDVGIPVSTIVERGEMAYGIFRSHNDIMFQSICLAPRKI